ncbi:MAG: 8-amino-7-oxononanoate synthase [Pseudomonadota bacterium]
MSQQDAIEKFAREKLSRMEARGLRRVLTPTHRFAAGATERDGARVISFCDNDYLGLSQDARVIEAAVHAAKQYGAGAGASRLVVGDTPMNSAIEQKLAAMKGLPAARLFGSGYLANIGVIPAIIGPRDLIVIDELSHACLNAGAQLSGAKIIRFKHNDVDDARQAFEARKDYGRALLITETVFSMDGDRAPLARLNALADEADAWLLTDDAHGFGVLKIENPAPLQMGTLSKGVGAYGGYICGPEPLIDLLISRARSLVYTTGLPPAVLGAVYRALEIIETEPALGDQALQNARLFCDLAGLNAPESAIVPVIVGDAEAAMALSNALLQEGFLVSAIRPPTVPAGTARLRFTFTAAHHERDIRASAAAFRAARQSG